MFGALKVFWFKTNIRVMTQVVLNLGINLRNFDYSSVELRHFFFLDCFHILALFVDLPYALLFSLYIFNLLLENIKVFDFSFCDLSCKRNISIIKGL